MLKHKVKNSEIRCIKNNYYLYAITSKWDPDRKRTKKISLGMLGVIKEKEGLIPKGQSKKGRPSKVREISKLTTKEFGASNLLQTVGF